MGLPGLIGGLFGGAIAIRGGSALARGIPPIAYSGGGYGVAATAKHFLTSPIVQGGQFGIGYTGGAYGGYGISNTWDPLGIHKPKYRYSQAKLGLPYGSYGRRRYSRGYSGYTRYSRRSYYRRRRPYYRRRSYY